jgi:hypothetical protein
MRVWEPVCAVVCVIAVPVCGWIAAMLLVDLFLGRR